MLKWKQNKTKKISKREKSGKKSNQRRRKKKEKGGNWKVESAFCYYNMVEVKQKYLLLNRRRLNARCWDGNAFCVPLTIQVIFKYISFNNDEYTMKKCQQQQWMKNRIKEIANTEQKTLTIFTKHKRNYIGM